MSALRSMAASLGGDVAGASILCPGPGHSPRDRSLSVTLSAADPEGFIVFSHAGDDWRECREHVLDRIGGRTGEPHKPREPARAYVKGDNSPGAVRLISRETRFARCFEFIEILQPLIVSN